VFTEASRIFGWAKDVEQVRRAALLGKAPVFAGLPRRFLGRIAARLFEKGYETGDVIFHEGDLGRGLFVILEGAVAITRAGSRGEQTLVTLAPGASFGELALIDDLPRSATARVLSPTRLLILYRTDFEALVEGDRTVAMAVMRNLLRTLAAYVRRTNAALADRSDIAPAAKNVEMP
jgi:CRP/FNR family cyclic AMP-dependent transcriptional regulator